MPVSARSRPSSGAARFFEIWSPAKFEPYKSEARKRALEKGRTLKLRQDGGK